MTESEFETSQALMFRALEQLDPEALALAEAQHRSARLSYARKAARLGWINGVLAVLAFVAWGGFVGAVLHPILALFVTPPLLRLVTPVVWIATSPYVIAFLHIKVSRPLFGDRYNASQLELLHGHCVARAGDLRRMKTRSTA